jgi:hypothetical protein
MRAPPQATAAPVQAFADPKGQLDLFAWRPKPRKPVQLSLFGDDSTE